MGEFRFNNSSYKNEKGKDVPAEVDVAYRKNTWLGPMPTRDAAQANDTIVTITPGVPGGTTQRITLSGKNSKAERFDGASGFVKSDYPDYWIRAAREAYKNIGNQPPYYKQFLNQIGFKQQGGTMQQQDVQKQIVALVQAAMQGDQKATQTVNQIMEAAKAGDQQAVQLAQMIQEVAKQMQGQATSAKWGSKLNYIKSLKYAKGGKACAVCDAKKVEEKACGGKAKKVKKRYFGGWL